MTDQTKTTVEQALRTYTQAEWDAQAVEYQRLHAFHHDQIRERSERLHAQDRNRVQLERRIAALEIGLQRLLDGIYLGEGSVRFDAVDQAEALLKGPEGGAGF